MTSDLARLQEFYASDSVKRLADVSADECADIAAAKRLYEKLHPETRNGANGGWKAKRNLENASPAFSRILAEKAECGLRAAEQAIRIGERLGPDIRARLRKSEILRPKLYRAKTELLALTAYPAPAQERILDAIEAGKATSIADAEERLKLIPPGPPKWERQVVSGWRQFTGFEAKAQREILRRAIIAGKANDILAELGLPPIEGDADEPLKITPVELEGFLSASELAEAQLPGLPRSKKGMIERAVTGEWRFVDVARRGGTTRLYSIEDLPGDARREYLRRRAVGFAKLGGGASSSRAQARDRRSEIVVASTVKGVETAAADARGRAQ